ncbi:MAG: hypothetical protein COB02_13280 [Candidatus Cloacimonadota bacterium]|nr:MAG: hypothetical protein COB02_13280 [Candidatus Cloacimonadota bacterium]
MFLSLFILFSNIVFCVVPPLNIPLKVNGSFCEYRESHFHGGIDLSTQKITGQDIIAIDDAYLFRVKNKVRGEGKALYLKHSNGDVSVYAHLESFSLKIKKYIKSQNRKKPFDLFPSKKIYFKEGELIGFSGESGSGFPHLHFEIRSSLSRSEKRSMYLSGVYDHIAPNIKAVYLVPYLKDKSLIRLGAKKNYKGKFGIAIKVDDLIDGSNSKCSIYKLSLYDNDKLIYQSKFDTIHYGRNPKTQMHFVSSQTHLSPTQYVYKMYKDFDKSSSYITKIVDEGVLKNGVHQIKVVVEDFHGNISKKSFNFEIEANDILNEKLIKSSYLGEFKLLQSSNSIKDIRAKIKSYSHIKNSDSRLEIIKIGPSFLFFMKRAQLIFRAKDTKSLYLSKWDTFTKKWKPLKTKIYPRFVSTNIQTTGIFSVKKDLTKPFISSKVYYYKGLKLTYPYIKTSDLESGIDRNSLRLMCGETALKVDYDLDRKWVLLSDDFKSCKKVDLKICDHSANCSEISYLN